MSATTPFPLLQRIAAMQAELGALHRELAAQRSDVDPLGGPLQLLRFRIGGAAAAMAVQELDEVVEMAALTKLPGAPAWVPGLLTIGEARLPVVDPAALEERAARALRANQYLMIAHSRHGRFALVVDALAAFETVARTRIHRPTAALPYAPYVVGVVTLAGDEETLVLGADALHPAAWLGLPQNGDHDG